MSRYSVAIMLMTFVRNLIVQRLKCCATPHQSSTLVNTAYAICGNQVMPTTVGGKCTCPCSCHPILYIDPPWSQPVLQTLLCCALCCRFRWYVMNTLCPLYSSAHCRVWILLITIENNLDLKIHVCTEAACAFSPHSKRKISSLFIAILRMRKFYELLWKGH